MVFLVVRLKTYNNNNYWSIISQKGLEGNKEGQLYVGEKAAVLCMVSGLDGANNSKSFRLFGHRDIFVNVRSSKEVHLDRNTAKDDVSKSILHVEYQCKRDLCKRDLCMQNRIIELSLSLSLLPSSSSSS